MERIRVAKTGRDDDALSGVDRQPKNSCLHAKCKYFLIDHQYAIQNHREFFFFTLSSFAFVVLVRSTRVLRCRMLMRLVALIQMIGISRLNCSSLWEAGSWNVLCSCLWRFRNAWLRGLMWQFWVSSCETWLESANFSPNMNDRTKWKRWNSNEVELDLWQLG